VLFDPESHEQLLDEPWRPAAIEAAIREIVAETEAAFDDGWPAHPEDEPEPRRFRTLYLGGSGVIGALHELQRRGLVELERDYVPYLDRDYVPDYPDDDHQLGLHFGETGIRLVLQRLAPSSANADRLAELIADNAHDEHRELMWGSAGTMLVAAELHGSTGELRWAELWQESASWLEAERDPESGIWTQRIVGKEARYLGPAHGFAGCMLALAAFGSSPELDEPAAAVTSRFAVEEDGLANWPPLADGDLRPHGQEIRIQWCHGAPGIVSSLAGFALDDSEHDRLLRAGGELTWRAGPLAKGPGLCHGTAGNGYAFLALLERTGDELWLERARAFAMHAAAQVARARDTHGRGRVQLWTGDPGAALYLADCLAGRAALPLP
jgi:Lanthionine synthetase C-like protein